MKKRRRELEPGTYVRLPTAWAHDRRIGMTEVRVAIYIDDKGEDAYPSAPTIARDLGMHERNVRKALDQMERDGCATRRRWAR